MNNTTIWTNNYCPHHLACFSTRLQITFSIIFACIIVGGVVGNLFVIGVILPDRKLLQSSINLFLLNLAIADFGNLLSCTPDVIQALYDVGWILPAFTCPSLRFAQEYFLYASVLLQMCIGVERFMAICNPLRRRFQRLSRSCSVRLIIGMWLIASAFAGPYFIYQHKSPIPRNINISSCYWRKHINTRIHTIFRIAECAILYVVPLALLSIVYTIMSYVLWGVNGAAGTLMLHVNNEQQMIAILRLRRSVVKMLMISLLFYFICYSPIQGLFFIDTILNQRVHIDHWLRLTLNALAVASSSVNPIIYTLCCRHFRNRFVQLLTFIFGCCLKRSPSTHDAFRRRIQWSSYSPYVSFRRSFRRVVNRRTTITTQNPRRLTITAV